MEPPWLFAKEPPEPQVTARALMLALIVGWLSSTERVLSPLFAQIRSTRPSQLRSADVTERGEKPTAGEEESTKPPLPILISIESVLSLEFAQIRSTFPSPLTSAAVTERGERPGASVEESTKPP